MIANLYSIFWQGKITAWEISRSLVKEPISQGNLNIKAQSHMLESPRVADEKLKKASV